MARRFESKEWEICGKWYSADTGDLKNNSSAWWLPARLLGISLEAYVEKLVNEFHANVSFIPKTARGNSLLIYSWNKQSDCHKYTLWINKEARNKNWTV